MRKTKQTQTFVEWLDTLRAQRWLPCVNGLRNSINEILNRAAAKVATGRGPGEQGGVVIKETIKEIVKVPCRYCGVLNGQMNSKCESCDAP